MRVRGLFLRSRVARRTFRALLAAALLPLAVFVTLVTQAYVADRGERQRRESAEFLRHMGELSVQRLTAARATLAVRAADGIFEAPALHDPAVLAVLQRLATVAADGTVHGEASLAADWQAAGATRSLVARELWWLPADRVQPARVMLQWPDGRGRGWWLAEVAPDFLWADFAEPGAATDLCLQDVDGRALRCTGAVPADAPVWPVALERGFGSTDWVLKGQPRPRAAGLLDDLLTLALMAGLAALLLIVVIGLVLVRRTMVPLEQLMQGTRRVAAGDWSARVETAGHDEFGQLAGLFNAMTARQQRRHQAMEAQAGIDREILSAVALPQVLQQVAARLQALAPSARVAVLAQAADGSGWQCHRPGEAAWPCDAPAGAHDTATDDGLAVHCGLQRDTPPWVRLALDLPPEGQVPACWVPARWQAETVAVLLLAGDAPLALDEDARREVGQLRDRSALAVASARREHVLQERALRDSLTGLLNRRGLQALWEGWLAAEGGPRPFELMFIDLDGFKAVNDALGHSAGDTLLRAVTERLKAVLPPQAVLARHGGDEFVAALPSDAVTPAAAEALAESLCQRLALPFVVRGLVQHLGASVGLVSSPADGLDAEELLRRADLAMYAAKREGRGRWRRFSAALDRDASERAWIQRDLRDALNHGGLEVHFQPRLALHDGHTCGAEALVRWHHPVHGWVPPLRFVPVAEETGLVVELGWQVLSLALVQCRRWRETGAPVGRVAVNVSARQLREPEFAEQTLAMVARHGLRPQDLEIEVTESLFAGEPEAVQRALAPLRAHGVQVALDDFGTGFSSLAALRDLPVDVLKIDRSFVVELGIDARSDAVVRAIVALARDLGKRTVAEGVETALQEQRLRALGCDEVQGWRYARALPGDTFVHRARTGFAAVEEAALPATPGTTPPVRPSAPVSAADA